MCSLNGQFIPLVHIIFLADISIAVIDLLQELTDVDTLNESEEGATALIDALVSAVTVLAPVFQITIHQINHYPVDKYKEKRLRIHWIGIYPVHIVIHLLNN